MRLKTHIYPSFGQILLLEKYLSYAQLCLEFHSFILWILINFYFSNHIFQCQYSRNLQKLCKQHFYLREIVTLVIRSIPLLKKLKVVSKIIVKKIQIIASYFYCVGKSATFDFQPASNCIWGKTSAMSSSGMNISCVASFARHQLKWYDKALLCTFKTYSHEFSLMYLLVYAY